MQNVSLLPASLLIFQAQIGAECVQHEDPLCGVSNGRNYLEPPVTQHPTQAYCNLLIIYSVSYILQVQLSISLLRALSAIIMAYSIHDPRKGLLKEALHKAKNAVFFDDRGNYADAIRAYGGSCALLGQVMKKPLESVDRETVEAIVRKILERETHEKRV